MEKTEQDRRKIFEFFDGQRHRLADPLLLARELDRHSEFRADVDFGIIEMANEVDANGKQLVKPEEAAQAIDRIVSAAHEAFGVKQFNDDTPGLTQLECLALINEFYGFLAALKKNGGSSPTPPPVTDAMCTPSNEPITNDTSH